MLNFVARKLAVFVMALAMTTVAHGSVPDTFTPKKSTRPAVEAELTGVWKQVAVEPVSPEVDLSDDWYRAAQYYLFLGEGKLKTLILQDGDVDLTTRYLGVWKKSPALWSFKLQGNGMTVLSHKDRGPMYLIRLETVVRDTDVLRLAPDFLGNDAEPTPRKGDVTMTYMDRNYRPVFYRLLRRYTPPQ
jgi:hypothetical protein